MPPAATKLASWQLSDTDNTQCHRWRQSWYFDNFRLSVHVTHEHDCRNHDHKDIIQAFKQDMVVEIPFCRFLEIVLITMPRALQWCHNEGDGVLNHRRLDCFLSRLFRRRSKKTSKLRTNDLCEGNPAVTGGFPSQKASNVENVWIWWRHYGVVSCNRRFSSFLHVRYDKLVLPPKLPSST